MNKFLIAFPTKEEAEEASSFEKSSLSFVFDDIRMWSVEEVNQTRRVWLEHQGLPLHGWSYLNLTRIGEVWGKVIYVDTSIGEKEDFNLV